MKTVQRFLLVLLWPTQPSKVVAFVSAIITAMLNNAYFANPSPTIQAIQDDLTAFIKALAACETKAVGTREARVAAELKLKTDVQHLMSFAQACVDANVSQAALMIASSGFQQKKLSARSRAEVALKWGLTAGTVLILVKSLGPRVTYFFQVSSDQKTWTSLTPSHIARATATGLTSGVTYFFRFQSFKTKTGMSDWSQVYSILVK